MYSKQSKVLCINMFRLNPYSHSHTNQNVPITLQVLQQLQSEQCPSKKTQVTQSLFVHEQPTTETDDDAQLRFPVYLNRNKRLMKKVRKDLEIDTDAFSYSNGLVMRQVPHIKKLCFEPETSDYMVYRRKTKLDLEEDFLKSYKTTLRFKQVLEARRLKIDESAKSSPTSFKSPDHPDEVEINVRTLD